MATILGQCIINWIMISLIYCLISIGFTLTFSVMGILNFAHGAIYMLGGYVSYYFIVRFGLGHLIGMVMSFLIPGLLGVLIYKGILRYFRAEVLTCLIITVGLANLFENGAYIIFGPYEKAVPSLTYSVIRSSVGLSLSVERLIVMSIALALMLGLAFFIKRTKPGRALRAVAEDDEAARLQGVNSENTFTLGMFVASGLAGIAGALMAPLFAIGPFVGQEMVVNSIIIIILGGIGSISGAVAGSFVLGLVTSFGCTFLSGDVATMISFALLLLILIFKPRGLLGGI